MQRESEDDAWRAIVENYGERPEVDPEPLPDAPPDLTAYEQPAEPPPPAPADEDRFVPPPPPAVPRPPRDRLAAWVGVFGAPAILLICSLARIDLPDILILALAAAFVGGFLYLVARMPRGPRDPWDDGAQV